jgi:phage/plasmid-like protein (TIGR03299 family)
MSHQIHFNEITQKHSFFSTAEKPWHNLGQIVSDYPASAEAVSHAGLDYEVIKTPLYTQNGESNKIAVPDYFATLRTDTCDVLGVVGRDYQIVQNSEAFAFFDSIVGGSGILYETAGALGKGERIFITAKLPDYIRVGKDDLIEKYLFLTTSHDGSGSITAAFTPIRIVCANTLNAALRTQTNTVRIRHTSNAKSRLEQAHKVMGISDALSLQLEDIFNHWSKVRIDDAQVKKLIALALAPSREITRALKNDGLPALSACFTNCVEACYEYAMSNDTQLNKTCRGTVFGAYNAVTGYFQNVRNYKDPQAKLKSLLLGGTAQQRGQRAFDLCADFARKENSALSN